MSIKSILFKPQIANGTAFLLQEANRRASFESTLSVSPKPQPRGNIRCQQGNANNQKLSSSQCMGRRRS